MVYDQIPVKHPHQPLLNFVFRANIRTLRQTLCLVHTAVDLLYVFWAADLIGTHGPGVPHA